MGSGVPRGQTGNSCSQRRRSGGPAGGQHGQPGAGPQEIGDERGGAQDVLDVVQQEQHLPPGEGVQQALGEGQALHLADVQGLGDRRGDETGVGEGGQVDETDPAGRAGAATAAARRVFPVPPGPVSVTRRTSGRARRARRARELPLAPDERARQRRQGAGPRAGGTRTGRRGRDAPGRPGGGAGSGGRGGRGGGALNGGHATPSHYRHPGGRHPGEICLPLAPPARRGRRWGERLMAGCGRTSRVGSTSPGEERDAAMHPTDLQELAHSAGRDPGAGRTPALAAPGPAHTHSFNRTVLAARSLAAGDAAPGAPAGPGPPAQKEPGSGGAAGAGGAPAAASVAAGDGPGWWGARRRCPASKSKCSRA